MIKRVGIVAKPRLTAVSADLPAIAAWLRERGVESVFDDDTADLAATAGLRRVTRDDLPRHVDLILLLGGDGTLLGMADRTAQAGLEVPILGVNFGGLGFLTEVTYDELYASLEAALAGTAPVESRLMLRAVIERDGQAESRALRAERRDGDRRVAVAGGGVRRQRRRRIRRQVPRRRHHRRDADRARPPTTSRPAARSSIPACTRSC